MRTVVPLVVLVLVCGSLAAWRYWPRHAWEPHQETVVATNPDGSHTYSVSTTVGELAGPGHRYMRFDRDWFAVGPSEPLVKAKAGYGCDTPREQVPDDLKYIWDNHCAEKGT